VWVSRCERVQVSGCSLVEVEVINHLYSTEMTDYSTLKQCHRGRAVVRPTRDCSLTAKSEDIEASSVPSLLHGHLPSKTTTKGQQNQCTTTHRKSVK